MPPKLESVQAELHLIVENENGIQTSVAAYMNHNQGTISRWLSANAERQYALIFNVMHLLWAVYIYKPKVEERIWQLMSAIRQSYRNWKSEKVDDETIMNQLTNKIDSGADFFREAINSSIDGFTKQELNACILKLDAHVAECNVLREKMDVRRLELARIEARNERNFKDKTEEVLEANAVKVAGFRK